MVRKDALLISSLIMAICWSASSFGGWPEFHDRVMLDWYRNNLWPQPFIAADRLATCSPFVTMTENGWVQESTLTSYHFDSKTHQLTEAGEMKVRHILTQQPDNFHNVYVLRGATDEVSSIRLDSVQQTAARILKRGSLPEIQFVNIPPRGMPAAEVDAGMRQYQATIPPPRLPERSGSSVGSSSN